MINVDFLPQTFVAEQLRRQRAWRQGALIAMVAAGMVGWFFLARVHLRERAVYARAVQEELNANRNRVTEMSKLQGQRVLLLHQVKVQRELAQPVNHTTVLATLGSLMPESLAMTGMTVKTLRPTPAAATTGPQPSPGTKKPAVSEPDLIRLEVRGLSPSDVEVANFVGRLTEVELFSNVKMHYSRAATVRGYSVREFAVELEVALDRDYQEPMPAPATRHPSPLTSEVAHAD